MNEPRVETDRDVVQKEPPVRATDVDPSLVAAECGQRADRIAALEPEITREVILRPERNADERQVALQCDLGHRGERSVATGDSERLDPLGHDLGGLLARPQDVGLDLPFPRGMRELPGRGPACA